MTDEEEAIALLREAGPEEIGGLIAELMATRPELGRKVLALLKAHAEKEE
ncbi:MAG: hypothetical protein J0L97_07105 [Alphaproteobacteria bacterium]|nr:hypothetical protein [Alphaproteobacteria bacterium]